jgi:hypothetical protein
VKLIILFIGLFLVSTVCGLDVSGQPIAKPVKIQWVKKIGGDFSFQYNWSYPEGVYKNDYGQLTCDGLCPLEIDAMKDSAGRIFDDSLKAFYQLVDTTHEFYTIACEAWCYEFGEANFINVYHRGHDTFYAYTMCNAGTHSSLNLWFKGDICYATIGLNSVTPSGKSTYYAAGGWIRIDKNLWKKGTMKAEFSFDFGNPDDPSKPLHWQGRIYAPIQASKKG